MARYEKHNEKSREATKDAFLALLAEKPFGSISMTDVARRSGISRSTLYLHFPNLQEMFEACVKDFLSESCTLKNQLRSQLSPQSKTQPVEQPASNRCDSCESGRPFCEMVRHAGKYQPLVNDPQFLPAAMEQFLETGEGKRVVDDYIAMGIDLGRARILATFQMTGCFTVATTEQENEDWLPIRKTIDTFILGGINAVRTKETALPNRSG